MDRLGDRAVRQRRRDGSARQRLGPARRQGGDQLRRRQAAARRLHARTRSPATTSIRATARSRRRSCCSCRTPTGKRALIYAHERDRDGDYALGDLSAIRIAPFRVARDFEGFTNRDINNTTVNLRGTGQNFAIESTTGFIKWKTEDETDLDYSPLPLATRSNLEESTQFTQEVRISSPENAPLALGSTMIKWQAGIEYFNQGYDQDAVNTLSAFVLSPQIGFPVAMHSPRSVDRHQRHRPVRPRHRHLQRQGRPDGGPALRSRIERRAPQHVLLAGDRAGERRRRRRFVLTTSRRSSRSAIASRPQHTAYAVGRRAATRPAASIRRRCRAAKPTAKSTRGTSKAASSRRSPAARSSANAAVFFIDWDDLQLNVPNPFVPGQFYIANVGGARSRGVEFDVTARPRPIDRSVRGARLHERAIRGRHHGRAASTSATTSCPTRRTTPRRSAAS